MDEALNAKYIIVRDIFGNEIPIVFSPVIKHKTVAKITDKENIISAGFTIWEGSRFIATGESISLEIKSRYDIDSDIINKHLNIRRTP
jgi:hypothetical protein